MPRLAMAAADARDSLRALIPRLEAAIAAGAVSTELLVELRALAVRHAESLRLALKAERVARSRKADSATRLRRLTSPTPRDVRRRSIRTNIHVPTPRPNL